MRPYFRGGQSGIGDLNEWTRRVQCTPTRTEPRISLGIPAQPPPKIRSWGEKCYLRRRPAALSFQWMKGNVF
jgi:hypothetical protein